MRRSPLDPLDARPGNLTDMVAEAIQEAIVERVLAPGERVSEAALAESLRVSKTPVREALLRLRFVGLVESEGRGLRVILPAASTIRYAYELRAGIERSATKLAAERASTGELAAIAGHARDSLEAARAGDSAGFRAADHRLHTMIADACRNPLLAQSHANALVLTRALRERDIPTPGYSVLCAEEHLGLAHALVERNGEAAGRLIYEHVAHVGSTMLAAYAEAPADEAVPDSIA